MRRRSRCPREFAKEINTKAEEGACSASLGK